MFSFIGSVVLIILLLWTSWGWSGEVGGPGPLWVLSLGDIRTILPPDTHLMMEASTVEQFLIELDGHPPDWPALYGYGHHDPELDERLFALNRERDAQRGDRRALSWLIAFAWTGELSQFDSTTGGFSVAIGPNFIESNWGMVRFKPEEIPGDLRVIPRPDQRTRLLGMLEKGQTVEIEVIMTGRLVPEESIIYDFSHDQEGLGLIMPVIRVERVEFVMVPEGPEIPAGLPRID